MASASSSVGNDRVAGELYYAHANGPPGMATHRMAGPLFWQLDAKVPLLTPKQRIACSW